MDINRDDLNNTDLILYETAQRFKEIIGDKEIESVETEEGLKFTVDGITYLVKIENEE